MLTSSYAGTNQAALAANQGITGLGKVMFTQPHKHGLFFRYGGDDGDGGGTARVCEVLEVFGKPTAKNELRGGYTWASPYVLDQAFTEGDVGGQRGQKVTSRGRLEVVWVSGDGAYRVGRVSGSGGAAEQSEWFAFRRLFELDEFFAALGMPTNGGSAL